MGVRRLGAMIIHKRCDDLCTFSAEKNSCVNTGTVSFEHESVKTRRKTDKTEQEQIFQSTSNPIFLLD
jgi:hypothetical protein